MRTVATLLVLGLLAPGCATLDTFVDADGAELGRVVVYRNGIAYRERRAVVDGHAMTLTVPADKVDDFLKSLTVTDARTGETLPVSYPTLGAAHDGKVEMTLQVPGGGVREVLLSYITEAPAWKPSYRVVIDEGGKVRVRGWAIVDNTSGEDWNGVRVGVGSSSALSFRYDLRTVRNVHRETLDSGELLALAPPEGDSTYDRGHAAVRIVGELADGDIPRPEGHPDLTGVAERTVIDFEEDPVVVGAPGKGSGRSGLGGRGSFRTANAGRKESRAPASAEVAQVHAQQAAARSKVRQLAKQLSQDQQVYVIEGFARAGEANADDLARDRANMLRNELVEAGVAPGRLRVEARGVVDGRDAGVRLVQADAPAGGGAAAPAAGIDDGRPVGESHFESQQPLTVARGTSAMVAILDAEAEGEIVYLFDPDGERGNERFAFKAVRFLNPTDSTLERGPVTVYGRSRFVGEGLTSPIPPASTAVIPFALDRQVVVERTTEAADRMSRLVTLQRGVLTTEVQHTRTTKLRLTNRARKAARLFLRHTIGKGWQLVRGPEVFERFGEAHLFVVELGPSESREVEIVEATPLMRTVDLRSTAGLDLVRVYLEGPDPDASFAAPVRELLGIHHEMSRTRQAILTTRDRMGEFRDRMGELEDQIVNLHGLKGGQSLMRHLQAKLKDMSSRIQAATIDVVDLQEKLMLTRIRFQDRVSELTLRPAGVADAG